MKPDEVRKLLGGYATGTLTDAERSLLLSAALDDQALFDALADEDALRDLLADATARQELLTALDSTATPEMRPWEQTDVRNLAAVNVAMSAALPPPSMRPATPYPPELLASAQRKSVWASFVELLTPRRMAIAGALAAIVLVVGAVRYFGETNKTELALNRTPATLSPLEAAREEKQLEQARPQPEATANSSPQADSSRLRIAQELAAQKAAETALGAPPPSLPAAPVPAPLPLPALVERDTAGRDKQIADERRAAPAAEGRVSAGGALTGASNSATPTGKDLEKKSEEQAAALSAGQTNVGREQPSSAARNESSTTKRADFGTASTATAPASAPKVPEQAEQAKAKPVPQAPPPATATQPTGVLDGAALGGFRQAPTLPLASRSSQNKAQPAPAKTNAISPNPDNLKQMSAKVSDVNGTIVSISVGTNAGLKAGEALEILRGDRAIGTVRLAEVGASFAVGPFVPIPTGTERPRAGDTVQRTPAAQPIGR